MHNDPEFARAVVVLAGHGGSWDTFVAGLRKYQADCLNSLVGATPDEIFVFQGRARAINDIITAIDPKRARAILDRIPNP